MTDELTTLVVDLINKPLERGEQVFVFSSGHLRGLLGSATIKKALPAETYRPASRHWQAEMENCLVLTYTPSSRKPAAKQKWTRKPVIFNIPLWAINKCVYLKKVGEMWMLNVNTAAPRPEKSLPDHV